MKMTIDEAIKHGKEQLAIFGGTHGEFIETSIDTMRKYQLFQVEYTKRLRADMVAMLEDLDLQIEALEEIPPYDIMDDWEHQICVRTWEVKQIIKEKINSLKED